MKHGFAVKAAVNEIVESLEKEIIFGFLLPRQRIYEDELMLRFDAKRHVVRSAVQVLEQRGIVHRYPNRGAQVKFYTRREVDNLYQLRRILHDAAARLIKLPPSPAWLDNLKRAQEAHSHAVRMHDIEAIYQHNNSFHHILFSGVGNESIVEAIEFSNSKTHGIRSHGLRDFNLQAIAEEEHRMMIDYIERGNLVGLAECCLNHMEPARKFYIEKYCPQGEGEEEE
ncbi:GntR family transcriptional regulator [Billgrantia pellis]|uniref:GntR family transcriptional regulator n=1 Tax=Billgrantia pellis TaxID=2606936 RepID=A0A7V7FZ66_9GAMM|nr:GntR family transcriptional regulator [Halomonas pellis]KAA0011990.1 GntR family transcriptional regulator [Halomonas pellis]